MIHNIRWHQRNNAEEIAHSTVHWILLKAQEAISHHGVFKILLAGGTTPKRVYEILAEQSQQWSKWQVYIGDERCLESNDPERNSLMIKYAWLNKVNFPAENFHPINTEHGAEQSAKDYAELIKAVLPFDISLLGIGEDGHTASLFPGHEHNENELVHIVSDSPKPPSARVSLSKKALFQSLKLIILVSGSGKQTAVKQWQAGENLPIAQIDALNGVDVLIDNDASPNN